MKKLIATAILATTLTACSSTSSNLFVSAVNGAYVVEQNGSLINTILKAELTADERFRVLQAQEQFKQLLEDAKKYEDKPLEFASDILSFKVKFNRYVQIYQDNLYNVAAAHWDEYNLDEQQAFGDTHKQLSIVHDTVDGYLNSLEYQKAMVNIGQYAGTVVKLYTLGVI